MARPRVSTTGNQLLAYSFLVRLRPGQPFYTCLLFHFVSFCSVLLKQLPWELRVRRIIQVIQLLGALSCDLYLHI